VDRLESLLPVLENAGFSHVYAAGPRKKHGCLIAFDQSMYFKMEERVIQYDEQEVGLDRRGNCIRTGNIGSIIALKPHNGQKGLIVATTHLFWHPKYVSGWF
jgi:RNA exonuclease NGL2